jgi:hypothetical protein
MTTDSAVDSAAPRQSLATRHLFRTYLKTDPPYLVGQTLGANRRVIAITGGTFEGERMRGILLPGGSDWITARPDGSVALNVRMLLQTDDGALIMLRHRGVRAGPSDVLARIDRGEYVDPMTYYMRTTMLFETSAEKYWWLNNIVGIATGARVPAGPYYDVYEVL